MGCSLRWVGEGRETPAPPVIPAKAGIPAPTTRPSPLEQDSPLTPAESLDPRFRGDDGGEGGGFVVSGEPPTPRTAAHLAFRSGGGGYRGKTAGNVGGRWGGVLTAKGHRPRSGRPYRSVVIPAKAGIQAPPCASPRRGRSSNTRAWIPAFAGMTEERAVLKPYDSKEGSEPRWRTQPERVGATQPQSMPSRQIRVRWERTLEPTCSYLRPPTAPGRSRPPLARAASFIAAAIRAGSPSSNAASR